MHRFRSRTNLPSLAVFVLAAFGAASTGGAANLRVPPHFEGNAGQWPADVKFLARQGHYQLALKAGTAMLKLGGKELNIRFPGATPAPEVEPLARRRATTNYFVGDRKSWRTGVPQYARVRYADLYPGIDLDYYWNDGQLEFDFSVRPGADPGRIRMRLDGADRIAISDAGDLVIEAGGEQLRQLRPVVYQDAADGSRTTVEGRYVLAARHEVRFELGRYDRARTLVVDPVLVYSTYHGGDKPELGNAIGVDALGTVWVAGNTSSDNLFVQGDTAFQDARAGSQDIFIARFDPNASGDSLLQSTFIGGYDVDEVKALHISPSGFIAIAGTTRSPDFPKAGNAGDTAIAGENDAFVCLINPFETGEFFLAYSNFLGGDLLDVASGVYVNAAGDIYVTGYTTSENFPVSGAPLQGNSRGGYELFITKLVPSRAAEEILDYSTYLGGTSTDVAYSIVEDAAGMIWVGGYTLSEDFPVAGAAYQDSPQGNGDLFLVKIDPSMGFPDALVYGTYFGGSGFDKLYTMKMDAAGSLVLAGYTTSPDFPVTGTAYQSSIAGDSDLFVTRFNPALPPSQAVTYSTLLGGSATDILFAADVDGSGRVVLTGYTLSTDFPVKGAAVQAGFGGEIDAFVAWIDPAASGASSLLGSCFLGGSSIDAAYGVAADFRGRAYVTGATSSIDFPLTANAWNHALAGIYDVFVSALDF